jgi:hypothetical protein
VAGRVDPIRHGPQVPSYAMPGPRKHPISCERRARCQNGVMVLSMRERMTAR